MKPGPDGQRCDSCRFWQINDGEVQGNEAIGECHRHAPSPTKGGYEHEMLKHITTLSWHVATEEQQHRDFNDWEEAVVSLASWWPSTWDDDWCGEHKPKEP